MLCFIGKEHDFRFDTGTVTRTDALDTAIVKWRLGKPAA